MMPLLRFDVLLAPEDELDVKQVLERVNGEIEGNENLPGHIQTCT